MARNSARSLLAAERRALAGENDSQDSQEKLLFLIQEHGIGVTTSSPTLDDRFRQSIKELTSIPTSNPATEAAKQSRQPQHLKDASHPPVDKLNTDVSPDIDADAVVITAFASSSVKSSSQRARQSFPSNAHQADKPPSLRIRDDAIPRSLPSTAPLKKQTGVMSSQSPTQTNEGRSYEQYARDGSQPSSPPGSFAEDPRTLQEGDTGYVNFKHPFDLPDTIVIEPETPFTRNNDQDERHDRSQFTSQMTSARRPNHFAPETPAAFPRPFLAGGNGQVMPASQLFGQTQPTSGLKKASPTSSRPSPNVFANNVTSPTHPTSSPLNNRGFGTSPLPTYASTSPGFPGRSSRPLDSRASRSPSLGDPLAEGGDQDENDIDKTPLPKLDDRRGRSGLEPIEEYRPYRKGALNNDAARSSSQHSLDSDFGRDEAELRRQRARSIKERASRSFPEISVPLPSSGGAKIEVPSTNRTKRSKHPPHTVSDEKIAQCHRKYSTDHGDSQETVADSQDIIFPQKSAGGTNTLALPPGDHSKSIHEDHTQPLSAHMDETEKEMIPETSPACTFVEPPKLVGDIMRQNSSAPSGLLTLSYPTPSAGALVEPSSSLNNPSQSEENTAVAHANDTTTIDSALVTSSLSIVLASSQQSDRRRSRRLNKHVTPSSTAPETPLPSNPGTRSSTLTVLSATPVISFNSTPNTDDNRSYGPLENIDTASPTADRGRRRGRLSSSLPNPSPSSTKLKTYAQSRRGVKCRVRQSSRHSSLSLDELDKSPIVSGTEDSRKTTRKPPRKSTTLREFQSKGGIFEGMVFAISFQERQQPPKCKDKSPSKSNLEDMIRQEGGRILDDGFNALFEVDMLPTSIKGSSTPILSSSLTLRDRNVGFAALIADGHSRKVKYMQALALGIPCLAPRWVTACVSKNEIVDWSSYLLCAGSSTLLGDAIRSRNLAYYDASTAELAQVISQRPKLLDQSKVLLIMKKTKNEEKRLPYVFLAQVLGASLVRVNSVEEARAKLREAESGNNTFDWVYVDEHIHNARTTLFGSGSSEGASKKRKRASAGTDLNEPPLKRIRTLNDELVIQSLILGRLIEEGELED